MLRFLISGFFGITLAVLLVGWNPVGALVTGLVVAACGFAFRLSDAVVVNNDELRVVKGGFFGTTKVSFKHGSKRSATMGEEHYLDLVLLAFHEKGIRDLQHPAIQSFIEEFANTICIRNGVGYQSLFEIAPKELVNQLLSSYS